MRKALSGMLLVFIALFSTSAYGDAFNPPPGEWKLSGPAMVGTLTIMPADSEPCSPGGGTVYVDKVNLIFSGKCKGQSVSATAFNHGIKICFEDLVADNLEGIVLTDHEWLPPECSSHEGQGPLILNTASSFEWSEAMIQAHVVFLFLVPAK